MKRKMQVSNRTVEPCSYLTDEQVIDHASRSESGEKFKAEIKVSTDGKPSHYGYKSCYYDWNKD